MNGTPIVQITTPNKPSRSQRRRANRRARKEAQGNATTTQVVVRSPAPPNQQSNPRKGGGGRRRGGKTGGRVNWYLRTLKNPFQVKGIKVPDLVSFPTSTFSMYQSGTLAPGGTTSDSVMITVNPMVGTGTSTAPINSYTGTTAGDVSTGTAIYWSSTGTVNGNFDFVRPVSAGLRCWYVGNSSNDAGYFRAVLLARNPTIGTTVSSLKHPGICETDLQEGAEVVWKPMDNADMEFGVTNVNTTRYPVMVIQATGLSSPTAAVIRWETVVNYECIPTANSLDLVQSSPSTVSLSDLQEAMNWGQKENATSGPLKNAFTSLGYPIAAAIMAGSVRQMRSDRNAFRRDIEMGDLRFRDEL